MRWIHDVSTDADDPPQFVALRAARLACPNGTDYSGLRGSQIPSGIAPKIYVQTPDRVYQAALAAAEELQWTIAAALQTDGRIEATATTRLLRFKDDVVIRLRAQGRGTRLDIRSASRIGSSDFGTNARRIRAFLRELDNRLLTHT